MCEFNVLRLTISWVPHSKPVSIIQLNLSIFLIFICILTCLFNLEVSPIVSLGREGENSPQMSLIFHLPFCWFPSGPLCACLWPEVRLRVEQLPWSCWEKNTDYFPAVMTVFSAHFLPSNPMISPNSVIAVSWLSPLHLTLFSQTKSSIGLNTLLSIYILIIHFFSLQPLTALANSSWAQFGCFFFFFFSIISLFSSPWWGLLKLEWAPSTDAYDSWIF